MRDRSDHIARKPLTARIVLPILALIVFVALIVVERPAWLTLKPATGTATAMAAAADLDQRR